MLVLLKLKSVKMYFFVFGCLFKCPVKMTGKQKFSQANSHLGQMLLFDQPLF